MKPIKMLSLAALAVLMAMAFAGASSAMAADTALCKTDESPCILVNQVTHVHEATSVNAEILNGLGHVKCGVLFLSTAVGALATTQVINGNFTYANCKRKKLVPPEENCTVAEINGPAEIKVLRLNPEESEVAFKFEVSVVCGGVINCVYDGVGLLGTGSGPLPSSTNGKVTINAQTMHKVSGSFCPEEAKLDIVTIALSATYISR